MYMKLMDLRTKQARKLEAKSQRFDKKTVVVFIYQKNLDQYEVYGWWDGNSISEIEQDVLFAEFQKKYAGKNPEIFYASNQYELWLGIGSKKIVRKIAQKAGLPPK